MGMGVILEARGKREDALKVYERAGDRAALAQRARGGRQTQGRIGRQRALARGPCLRRGPYLEALERLAPVSELNRCMWSSSRTKWPHLAHLRIVGGAHPSDNPMRTARSIEQVSCPRCCTTSMQRRAAPFASAFRGMRAERLGRNAEGHLGFSVSDQRAAQPVGDCDGEAVVRIDQFGPASESSRKFIAGDPMNPATKVLAGLL